MKFGSKKMIIKALSIPDDMRENWLDAIHKWTKFSIFGCWEWQGRIHNGYPCIRAKGHSSTMWAHRVSYALFNGPIKEGMQVDHKCNNPICINPSHLEQMTSSDNCLKIKKRRIDREQKLLDLAHYPLF